MVEGRTVNEHVSFDVNPTSRQMLQSLADSGLLANLVRSGARIHQAGCGGCIGMGQAPATGKISLRTVPRNFPGRSGTKEDSVYLCSPETAAASALTGVITEPRTLDMPYPVFVPDTPTQINTKMLVRPSASNNGVKLEKGPNIKPLPAFDPLPENLEGPVLLKLGDDVSTDEIMPAGAEVLPYRSNIPEISRYVFNRIEDGFYNRVAELAEKDFWIVGGHNYGQGSSREHAAIAPRYMGLRIVIAKSFARIHWQNLANFGILPLTFIDPSDYDQIHQGDRLDAADIRDMLNRGNRVRITNLSRKQKFEARHALSDRQIDMILAGSLINVVRRKNT